MSFVCRNCWKRIDAIVLKTRYKQQNPFIYRLRLDKCTRNRYEMNHECHFQYVLEWLKLDKQFPPSPPCLATPKVHFAFFYTKNRRRRHLPSYWNPKHRKKSNWTRNPWFSPSQYRYTDCMCTEHIFYGAHTQLKCDGIEKSDGKESHSTSNRETVAKSRWERNAIRATFDC